ncbi:U-box domain-containing protein 13 [Hibiscus syriacus]|uniref:RING-type E3 ubiquitin transferase n=1 Tax=Hibiscus syriacus TaxID=106335 RepID=A0A6A3CLA2_HIBSY|nr:U-box domain-containing protein 13-like [Hibiscus syriacus]KAE8729477.1 U-box domain-containing protein 13 [Hibiscus syriacus]
MEEEKGELVQSLIDAVNQIAPIGDYRCAVKKEFCNLSRRLKLLTPMFEEIGESKEQIPEEIVKELVSLKEALISAKELLRLGREGSKIYLVLERDQIMRKFHEVTARVEQALSGITYEDLDISDEVKEQVELVLAQFRRAKGRVDAADVELYEYLLSLYNKSSDAAADPDGLRRLVEKLQLVGVAELTQESLALHEMVSASGGDSGETFEKMSNLLNKIKDFVQTENPNLDAFAREKNLPPSSSGQVTTDGDHKTPVIPDDFRCPISLELMKDPVIVSTGQTYERSCIEKWLEQGHGTCPKTQQTLSSCALTPNYVLRSLIAQWCEANGIEPPKRPSSSQPNKTTSACSPAERTKIEILLRKLASCSPEDQRMAAGEIRLLAKRNADNRVAIAEAGAIPLLVALLSTPDSRTQEHAVTALLNLSICEDNKGSIMSFGAVPGIVQVLKKGSMEARENAAAALFSLSVVDENKVTIGASGAIPLLVTLLSEGTQRGKKDAATALFNLCIYQGNKGKAVRAGVVPTLMRLLTEPGGGMVDEALAILAILSSHPEGKSGIGAAEAVPVLVDVIGNGSPRNKENAAAVLVHLCAGDQQHLAEAQELGVMGPLLDLAQNGTDRGKRKAAQLLERMSRFIEQQKLGQAQAEAHAQSETQHPQPPSVAYAIDR